MNPITAVGPVAWHDVECSTYGADLPLWRSLAAEGAGPVLDLGAGTGRVALDLAAQGHRVTALDSDPELARACADRARERDLPVESMTADARTFDLDREFELVILAMQVVQLLGGRRGRAAMLARARDHLAPAGRIAMAVSDPFEGIPPADSLPPLPDVLEVDGWVLSSIPVDVREEGKLVAIDRRRQAVSPAGELTETAATIRLELLRPEDLAAEARDAGLEPLPHLEVPSTHDFVGSTVVVAEQPA